MFGANWKTNLAGISAALVAAGAILKSISSGDMPSMLEVSALITAVGMIFARDAKVSDEQAGAGKK